jgi:hypothetical protein
MYICMAKSSLLLVQFRPKTRFISSLGINGSSASCMRTMGQSAQEPDPKA